MKHTLVWTFGVMVLGLIGFAANPAGATTAAGPYYANPAWDQTLPSSTRFIVLSNMNSEAVLDRETGLVWERSPSTSASWYGALFSCNNLAKGNRRGWRLPTLQELMTLVDPSVGFPGPALPAGHPFQNVQSASIATGAPFYWTATTNVQGGGLAWTVYLGDGGVSPDPDGDKSANNFVWCVRGGQGVDPQ